MLLTFDLFNLPTQIDIAWRRVNIRQYIPNPMRCRNCQLLGHTVKHCRGIAVCKNCSLPPHDPLKCTRTFCANCHADHPASSNKCPKYVQAKQIQAIKVTKKCTMREAQKIYNSTVSLPENAPSFSSIASRSTITENKQDNQHRHSSPLDIPTNSQASIHPHSSIEQKSFGNDTETLNISSNTIINEPSTQIPESYSRELTDIYLNNHDQSYHALTQLNQTLYNAMNNSNLNSNSNALPIHLPSNCNSDNTQNDSIMITEDHIDYSVIE